MQLNTLQCVLTDLLNCGYADLDMLDILYSPLAESLMLDTEYILKSSIEEGNGLNSVLWNTYNEITNKVYCYLEDLISDYTSTLDKKGNPTEETKNTELHELLEEYLTEGDTIKALTSSQIETISKEIKEMSFSTPFCNCLDSYFQNDLDQIINEDVGLIENCKALIEYWVFKGEN